METSAIATQTFGEGFWLSVLVALIGVAIIAAILWFGQRLLGRSETDFWGFQRFTEFWQQSGIRPNLPRYFVDALSETLQRRNEFWVTYGQVVIATLVIVVLSILLLTKTISAEAGLPLLSAVSGFAIAKGVNSNRGSSGGPDREQ